MIRRAAGGTTYLGSALKLLDWFSLFDLDARFTQLILNGKTCDAFPAPHQQLGSLTEPSTFVSDDELDKPNIAPGWKENFLAGGFEGITVTLESAQLQDAPPRALVKVSHPAKVLNYNFHGYHSGELQDYGHVQQDGSQRISIISPAGATFPSEVKTIFFASCQVLDLHDYNNFYSAPFVGSEQRDPKAPLGTRSFGGERWYQATGSGRITLLGYDGITTPQGVVDCWPYFRALLDTGASQPVAWVKGHLTVAGRGVNHTSWLQGNACAYDSQAYYCISYDVPQLSNYEEPLPAPLEGHQCWRIPRAKWTLERADWSRNEDLKDVGEQIP